MKFMRKLKAKIQFAGNVVRSLALKDRPNVNFITCKQIKFSVRNAGHEPTTILKRSLFFRDRILFWPFFTALKNVTKVVNHKLLREGENCKEIKRCLEMVSNAGYVLYNLPQCGNLRILVPLIFYVKSKLAISGKTPHSKVSKIPNNSTF